MFCLEVPCWSTAHFVFVLSSSCSNSFALRRCFGWRQAWRLCQGARSHGAPKSAASLAQLRFPASYESIAEVSELILLDSRWQKQDIIAFRVTRARANLILLIRNHGGTRVANPDAEKSGYGGHPGRVSSGASFIAESATCTSMLLNSCV